MKIDTTTLIIGGGIALLLFNSSSSSNSSSGLQPTGTVDIPGQGSLPATQSQGVTYVLVNGQWVLLSALQAAYEQQTGNNSSGGGSGLGDWLTQNAGQIINIITQIFGNNNNNNNPTTPTIPNPFGTPLFI